MAPARDRVETLERRRRDRQLRSLGRRERGEEERDGRVDPGDQRRPALHLVACGRLVDGHLDVYVAPGGHCGLEARLMLVPARALAGVARALEIEAHDRDV